MYTIIDLVMSYVQVGSAVEIHRPWLYQGPYLQLDEEERMLAFGSGGDHAEHDDAYRELRRRLVLRHRRRSMVR